MRNKHIALAAAAVALVGLFAAGWTLSPLRDQSSSSANTTTPAAARTALPGLDKISTEPTLASLARATPPKGQAVQASGPFDDRFTLRGLAFDGSRVTGSASITSDVSDILEFEALAGFYDAQGRLLGTSRFTYHHDESQGHSHNADGTPSELATFTIAVPAKLRGAAVSAAVGVPVLVNE